MTEDKIVGGVLYTEFTRLMQAEVGGIARMIGGSKSGYRSRHPGNIVYFNACIFNEKFQLVWCGDLDITLDMPKLKMIAEVCNGIYYVTPESVGCDLDGFGKFGKKRLDDERVIEIGRKI